MKDIKANCKLSINEDCDEVALIMEFSAPVDPMEIVEFIQDYVDSFKDNLKQFGMMPDEKSSKH